ncbi:MAG TPA: hypothetical protein VF912_03640 [Anaeromyxobacter sp.]
MTDPEERLRERELERRRENELKDLDVEETPGERPLEGLSGAEGTTWTPEQDDRQRSVHEGDEAASRARSRAQVPPAPPHHEE